MVDVLLIVIMVAIAGYLVMSKMKPKVGKQPTSNKAPQPAARAGGRSAPAPAQRPRPVMQPQAPAPRQVPASAPHGGWDAGAAHPVGRAQAPMPAVGWAPTPAAAPVFGAVVERAATVYLAEPVRVTLEVTAGVDRGTRFVLAPGDNHVGRAPNSVVRLMDSTVSNQHAIIRIDGSEVLLFDNASTNGTFVGLEQVLTPRALVHGNELRMGNTTVVVHI